MNRKIEIRYTGPGRKPWRLYWSGTEDLATEERFANLELAGAAARTLMADDDEDALLHA